MGKSKKTRWRALDLDGGSQDETLSSDAAVDTRIHNGDSEHAGSVTSHKYSQILGDHHNTTNNSNNNSTTSAGANGKAPASFPFTSYNRSKSYNNKENYYNQRSLGGRNNGAHRSWQRGGSYRSTFYGGKDKDIKRPDENLDNAGKDAAGDSTVSEPKRFNEDEYTRITTPRQDVLFKKGYLSRNINKTVSTTTTTATTATNPPLTTSNSVETAASSSATDPDSSVSTLSPATTPSMEFGGNQADQIDPYGQMYYPGLPGYNFDDSGMLVTMSYPVPFNGYPPYAYPTSPGSPGSPMILMPYNPYAIDPFFMPPEGIEEPTEIDGEQVDGKVEAAETVDVDANESAEKEETNEQENEATNHNGVSAASSPISTSDAGATESNNHEEADGGDEAEEEEDEDQEKQADDQIDGNGLPVTAQDDQEKPEFQFYPSEHLENYRNLFIDSPSEQLPPPSADYGNFIYPAFPNNFYNNGYFIYNGQPNRPPKMKRRKRFPSYRNNNQSRSTETTTDDENTSHTKFSGNNNYKYQQSNGWPPHQQPRFFYDRVGRDYWDQNRNNIATSNGFHLNAEVKEFYPQTKVAQNEEVPTKVAETKPTVKVAKPSQMPAAVKPQKVTKREIMQGIKSMEQQNIDLMATKHTLITAASQDDDEWNVIMKGKKVKIVRDESSSPAKSAVVQDVKSVQTRVEVRNVVESMPVAAVKATSPTALSTQTAAALDNVKKSSVNTKGTNNNSKKSKSKGKKKKPNLMAKQDGFEIIEPEFAKTSLIADEIEDEHVLESSDIENETLVSDLTINQVTENQVLLTMIKDNEKSDECIKEVSAAVSEMKKSEIGKCEETDSQVQQEKIINENSSNDLTKAQQEDIDTVIDISDEDICSSKVLLSLEKEIEHILDANADESSTSSVSTEIETIVVIDKSPKVQPEEQRPAEPANNEITLETIEMFNDHVNIADLERDVIENLKQLGADEDIELKCPIINPLYDFPITSAVQKWLQAKQNESFENLFHVQNLKKLSEIYDEDEDDDDEDEETESDISEKELKSETDSDYASDFHAKTNGNSPTCSNHAKVSVRSLNSKLIATKESFCALM